MSLNKSLTDCTVPTTLESVWLGYSNITGFAVSLFELYSVILFAN